MSIGSLEKEVKLDIIIPAYDLNHNGLIVSLKLVAKPSAQFRLMSNGVIANSLERSFTRIIHIMMSLKSSWNCLGSYQYALTSFNENFNVRDVRSADLALCVAALNIIRNHHRKNLIDNYIGTGSLRIDGSFNETFLEEVKKQAVNRSHTIPKKFINSKSCNHIFDLEALLECY